MSPTISNSWIAHRRRPRVWRRRARRKRRHPRRRPSRRLDARAAARRHRVAAPSKRSDRHSLRHDRSQPRDVGRAHTGCRGRAGSRPQNRRPPGRGGSLHADRRSRARSRHERPQGREAPRARHDRQVNLKRTPIAPIAVAFAGGIAVASLAALELFLVAWLVAVVACLASLAVARTLAAAAALLLGVVAVGALRGSDAPLPPEHVGRLALPQTLRVEGRLVAEPRRWAPDRARLLLDAVRVDDEPRVGLIQVAAYGVLPPLTEGQRVAAPLRLSRATGFRNPGTYDYAAHLARDGIFVLATTRADSVTALGRSGAAVAGAGQARVGRGHWARSAAHVGARCLRGSCSATEPSCRATSTTPSAGPASTTSWPYPASTWESWRRRSGRSVGFCACPTELRPSRPSSW